MLSVVPPSPTAPTGSAADAKATGDALELVAPEWESGSSYAAYDAVKYNGAYYYAKQAIANSTTAPSSDTTHWGSLANLAAIAHQFLPVVNGTFDSHGYSSTKGMFILNPYNIDFVSHLDERTLYSLVENGGVIDYFGNALVFPTRSATSYGLYQFALNTDIPTSMEWSQITGKPSSFAPSAHKSTHATGGTDALTPSDIGAVAKSDIAADYSASTAYSVGQLAWKDGALKKCTTAGTGPAAAFAAATVEDVLAALRTALDGKLSVGNDGTVSTSVKLTGSNIARLATVSGGGVVGNFTRFRIGAMTDEYFIAPAYDAATQKYGFWVKNGANDAGTFYALADFAPLASPAFTGTPTAPTPTAGDSSTKVATTEFVQDRIGQKLEVWLSVDPQTGVVSANYDDGL